MSKSIVIVVHGDRSGEAERSLRDMVQTLRKRNPALSIEPAVLMTNPPELHLANVVEALVIKGVDHVVIVPWFLFAGPHVLQDIPQLVEQVQQKFPNLRANYAEPLAMDPIMVQLLESRLL